MPDKKLTDNEIVKALECCADEMGCVKGCPCFDPKAKGSHCTVSKKLELEKLTIDLINRLQAEIERKDKIYIDLLKTSGERADIISSLQAENERLKDLYEKSAYEREMFLTKLNDAKAEAYKEFAERLKEKTDIDNKWCGKVVLETHIDNLLKELVGDSQ